jgi:hypothetical protein
MSTSVAALSSPWKNESLTERSTSSKEKDQNSVGEGWLIAVK